MDFITLLPIIIAVLIIAFTFTGYFSKAKDSTLATEISDLLVTHIKGSKANKILDIKDALAETDTTIAQLSEFKLELDKI